MSSDDSLFVGADGKPFTSLPDYLAPDLRLISIGLNPSINSVKAGYYFATPTNRFWKALNASELLDQEVDRSRAGVQRLFERHRMGFTDVVKRPTPGATDLRAVDFRYWSPVLEQKIRDYSPRVAWFHGKVAWQRFLKATDRGDDGIEWGEQPGQIQGARVFVSPNPSPANAVFSLQDLITSYNLLNEMIKGLE